MQKLDALQGDVSDIKNTTARHEERSISQHDRICKLERATQKAVWLIFAGIGPLFLFLITLIVGC
jgi:hypothetical protein